MFKWQGSMHLAGQDICAWSHAWDPTSADRSPLPPLPSRVQLLHPAASRSGRSAAGRLHFSQCSSLTFSPSSSQLRLCPRLWTDRRGQRGAVQAAARERTVERREKELSAESLSLASRQGRGAGSTVLHAGDESHHLSPLLGKETGSSYAPVSCTSHLRTCWLLTELHVLQTGCHRPPPRSRRACLLPPTHLSTCSSRCWKSHQPPLPAPCSEMA